METSSNCGNPNAGVDFGANSDDYQQQIINCCVNRFYGDSGDYIKETDILSKVVFPGSPDQDYNECDPNEVSYTNIYEAECFKYLYVFT